MKYLVLLFMTNQLWASGVSLSPTVVKNSAIKHHPSVLAAIDRVEAGIEDIKGARGSFDTKITSDYKRQTKHGWNTTLSRTQIEKPLRFANSKIYAGTEQISNPFGLLAPIYNTGNPSGQTGNYTLLGLQFSLWKNLLIDPERAALRNAKFDAKIAKANKKLTELDIARMSQFAYWEWVTAKKLKELYEELLINGEKRNEYLNARSKRGDVANILVTENEQYVASRKSSLQSARERLLRAEYALSLFYRDENGNPILPQSIQSFEDFPKDLSVFLNQVDLTSKIEDLINKRPDLKNLDLNVQKTEIDLELAKQDLKPQVDVTTEYFERTNRHPDMPKDYLMVMAQVSIPIERNFGKGNIAAARARRMAALREKNLGIETYKIDVMSLRQALVLQLEQVRQSEIEFVKAKDLVESEEYKFRSGGGNLFLVNLREEAQANAEASFNESRLSFMNTLLSYQALVSTID